LFCLGSHTKEVGDERHLALNVAFGNALDLSFANHVHTLISLQRLLRRLKRKETHTLTCNPSLGTEIIIVSVPSDLYRFTNTYQYMEGLNISAVHHVVVCR
jgi:hypothetical protein